MTDRDTLDAIRRGDSDVWARLIDEYQGRLLRFATARVPQAADAEDVVQDTFASLIRVMDKLQIEASLETYLFSILRNEIANRFRTRWSRNVCLIQDIFHTEAGDPSIASLEQLPAGDPSVSWCVSHYEQHQLQREVLADALDRLVRDIRESLRFRDLKVAELVFYCQLSNADVARLLDVDEGLVRVIKHRCLKRVREDIAQNESLKDVSLSYSEGLLTEVWETRRLSCPERDTLAAFVQESLSPEWFDYVDFHLTTMGCHFCRASYKDLREQLAGEQRARLHRQILTSTAGFLSRE